MGYGAIKMAREMVRDKSIQSHFSWMQRWALRKVHPSSIVLDLSAVIWSTYFLWNHQWIPALAIMVIERAIATYLVRNISLESLADSTWGKLALLHLHPANLVIQTLAVFVAIWGIWQHAPLTILIGITLLILGHSFGWAKVDARFNL